MKMPLDTESMPSLVLIPFAVRLGNERSARTVSVE
jgi:hypothetical protein